MKLASLPAALLALTLGAAGVGVGHAQARGGFADPSAVVSAELALNQAADKDGQEKALRDAADKDAVLFTPGIVSARRALDHRTEPAKPGKWAPLAVYMACDGGYGVATGRWTGPDGAVQHFVTIWREQRKGGYKWLLDWRGGSVAKARNGIDMIEGKVADCGAHGERGAAGGDDWSGARNRHHKRKKMPIIRIADPPPANGAGQSNDGSLRWHWTSGGPDGARSLQVTMRYHGADKRVVDEKIGAPGS